MSKKIEATNSPFPWDWFPQNAVQAWVAAEKAELLPDGRFRFFEPYLVKMERRFQTDTAFSMMVDDGVQRRYQKCYSGGIPVKQLKPVKQVGTGSFVSKRRDKLVRRQPPRPKAKTIVPGDAA